MCRRQERRLFELLAAALVALGPACKRQPVPPPAAPAKTPPPATPSRAVEPVGAGLSMPERIQRFLTEWTSAQARGDLAAVSRAGTGSCARVAGIWPSYKHLLLLFEVMPEMLPPRLVRVCGGRTRAPTPRPGRRTGYLVFDGAVVSTRITPARSTCGPAAWATSTWRTDPSATTTVPGDVPNPVSDNLEAFGGRQATIHYGPYCQEGGD